MGTRWRIHACVALVALGWSCRQRDGAQGATVAEDAPPAITTASVSSPIAPLPAPVGDAPLTVRCASDTLQGVVPASWVPAPEASEECPARFSLTLPDGKPARASVQCLAPRRTGLAQLDALYLRFRNADGSTPERVGTGYAGLSTLGGMRLVHVEASGVLAQPLPCASAARVGSTYGLATYLVEAPTATFAIELGGEGAASTMSNALTHTMLALHVLPRAR
jgi:hypothetical protein